VGKVVTKRQVPGDRDRIIPRARTGGGRRRWLAVICAAALLFLLPPVARAHTAVQVIEKLQNSLLQVMKNAGTLGYTGRYEKLAPVLPKLYDFPFISRIVLGRYWHTFSDGEKKEFLTLFARFSIATYAYRFDGYSGERFSVVSAKTSQEGRMVVRTVLIQPSGERTHLDYILHRRDGAWRIINVIADGVSDLALKHADFGAFLRKNSPKALLDKLKSKIAYYSDHRANGN